MGSVCVATLPYRNSFICVQLTTDAPRDTKGAASDCDCAYSRIFTISTGHTTTTSSLVSAPSSARNAAPVLVLPVCDSVSHRWKLRKRMLQVPLSMMPESTVPMPSYGAIGISRYTISTSSSCRNFPLENRGQGSVMGWRETNAMNVVRITDLESCMRALMSLCCVRVQTCTTHLWSMT